ncbi:hypothetical protein H7K45_06985 [Mycobacterium yunnanensis]|uniref:Uncharacterized protein n=1 Tax=Mycobacterium yunnanensis TaxID=368477 RepID=A0A9X2YZI6_9MYCO|nr:hypothetical protein [Mycobacterium yunnanensis]MCV7420279.1 hypothetical protein [Mycobacterium yunnanensis]
MTTNEYLAIRPLVTETALPEPIWTQTTVEKPGKRGWFSWVSRRGGRVRREAAPSTRHARREDFLERAAMSREMHRL